MSRLYHSIAEMIGDTPVLELAQIRQKYSSAGKIFAKLEFMNPAGSVKDRVALSMIEGAERRGTLQPGGTRRENLVKIAAKCSRSVTSLSWTKNRCGTISASYRFLYFNGAACCGLRQYGQALVCGPLLWFIAFPGEDKAYMSCNAKGFIK